MLFLYSKQSHFEAFPFTLVFAVKINDKNVQYIILVTLNSILSFEQPYIYYITLPYAYILHWWASINIFQKLDKTYK